MRRLDCRNGRQLTIRDAEPERDAAACAAIYAPYVERTPISFEERPPDAARDGKPDRPLRGHPPLARRRSGGEVVGYAYACRHLERAAYRWAADVSVYVAANRRGEGLGRGLYEGLFERLRAPGLPDRLRRHHPAQPRQRRACTRPRLHPVGVSPRDRLEGRRLARRRLVAAGAGAGHAGDAPGAAAAPEPASTRLPLSDARRASTHPASRRRAEHSEVLTEEDVFEALEEVIDPELGLDFVSLGLVYDVEIEKEDVYVTFTLTTPACPIGPQVSEQMKEFVGDLPGVSAVHPKMVFDPAWSPEMMTDDAKFALGF